MKYVLWVLVLCVLVLAGCALVQPESGEDDVMDDDNVVDMQDKETEQADEQEDVLMYEFSSNWDKDDAFDSLWNGEVVVEVSVKKETRLSPWFYAADGQDPEQMRKDCEGKLANGETSDECPTSDVLFLERVDGESFPLEMILTRYNNVSKAPAEVTIWCMAEQGRYAAPLWNFRDPLETVISATTQQQLLDAEESWDSIWVRITKDGYMIGWREWTLCDIFFTSLEVVS